MDNQEDGRVVPTGLSQAEPEGSLGPPGFDPSREDRPRIKLTQQAKDTLHLIQRSPDVGDGWRNVSPALRPNMVTWLQSAEELYEFDGTRIRLSHEGLIVCRYL